jgi:uncharacterized protein (TIGR00730 family)
MIADVPYLLQLKITQALCGGNPNTEPKSLSFARTNLFQKPMASVAVFCGSKSGNNEQYKKDSEALGTVLARNGLAMIYGGGRNGLMGYVADAVMQAGGTVRGIMPQSLVDKEAVHLTISELTVVDGMHERKRLMYDLCDAALILPGGFGTLDEFFEILTWNGLSLHDKKIFILNSGGFYNHLLQHLQVTRAEGFLYDSLEAPFTVLETPEAFQKYLPL